MDTSLPVVISAAQRPPAATVSKSSARGLLYLKFTLGSELFAVDIQRIREIIGYTVPSAVPMMPETLLGVINVRGSVVPVIDLSRRFGWKPTVAGRRTSIVIVEIEHDLQKHVLGLMVDRVNAVTEIADDAIEPVPAFGASIDTNFISGIAKSEERFVVILCIERTLSVAEISSTARASAHLSEN